MFWQKMKFEIQLFVTCRVLYLTENLILPIILQNLSVSYVMKLFFSVGVESKYFIKAYLFIYSFI